MVSSGAELAGAGVAGDDARLPGPQDGLGVVHLAVDVVEPGLEAGVLVVLALVDELGLAGHLVEDHRDVAALDVVVRAEEAGVAVAAHPLVVGGGVDVLGRPEVVGDVLEDLACR